jgi:hypothetical protein
MFLGGFHVAHQNTRNDREATGRHQAEPEAFPRPGKDEGRARTRPNACLMRRMQNSNVRELRRLTNLPLKLEHYERKRGAVSRDVLEK